MGNHTRGSTGSRLNGHRYGNYKFRADDVVLEEREPRENRHRALAASLFTTLPFATRNKAYSLGEKVWFYQAGHLCLGVLICLSHGSMIVEDPNGWRLAVRPIDMAEDARHIVPAHFELLAEKGCTLITVVQSVAARTPEYKCVGVKLEAPMPMASSTVKRKSKTRLRIEKHVGLLTQTVESLFGKTPALA